MGYRTPNIDRLAKEGMRFTDSYGEQSCTAGRAAFTGQEAKSPRPGFIYFDDDGNLVALRYGSWKMVFMEQRCPGTLQIWAEPFTPLRVPKLFNLRTDPFERADITSNTYWDWYMSKGYMIMGAQSLVTEFLETFKDFPPRQKAASFTIDQALEKMSQPAKAA